MNLYPYEWRYLYDKSKWMPIDWRDLYDLEAKISMMWIKRSLISEWTCVNPENDFIKKSLRTKEANQLEIKANDARVREASLS